MLNSKNPNSVYDHVWDTWLEAEGPVREQIGWYTKLHRPMYEAILRLVAERQRPHTTILEVGCSRAIDSYYLASKFGFDAGAIDLSESAIEAARKIGEYFGAKIDLSVGDITKRPYGEKVFDIVFSQGLIEHFNNPIDINNAQLAALKDDGFLIIDVPQKWSLSTVIVYYRMMMASW